MFGMGRPPRTQPRRAHAPHTHRPMFARYKQVQVLDAQLRLIEAGCIDEAAALPDYATGACVFGPKP